MKYVIPNLKLETGVEFSNDYSFFTYEQTKLRSSFTTKQNVVTQNKKKRILRVKFFPCKQFVLQHIQNVSSNKHKTKITLIHNKDFTLNDFVARYKLPFKDIESVKIGQNLISKFQENKYYQFDASILILNLVDNTKVKIESNSDVTIIPKTSKLSVYVKKNNDKLIVHVRILPKLDNQPVVKLCNKHFATIPLPKIIARLTRSIFPVFFSSLLYYSEKKPSVSILRKIINPVAFYNFTVNRRITVGVTIEHLI